MNIVKSCEEIKPKETVKATINITRIPTRTIFRYGAHAVGPYMRTTTGYVNLENGQHFQTNDVSFEDLLILSNCYLVTGEK